MKPKNRKKIKQKSINNCGLKSEKKADDQDEKCRKVKLTSDGKLYLNKTREIPAMVLVRAIFYENNKYYPQDFLVEHLYKI